MFGFGESLVVLLAIGVLVVFLILGILVVIYFLARGVSTPPPATPPPVDRDPGDDADRGTKSLAGDE